MFKRIKVLSLSLVVAMTLTATSPARAALAASSFGTTTTVIMGLVMVGGSGVLTFFSFKQKPIWQKVLLVMAAIPLAGLGLLVLDGENGKEVSFGPLESSDADALGVTAQEIAIYNSEIDQANFITSEVVSAMESVKDPRPEDSVKAWEDVKENVSPETIKVMQQILLKLAK